MRVVQYRLKFPNKANCPPANTPPAPITVLVETGATVFDVMIAAADANDSYDFTASYFGDSGFFINAVNGTANAFPCFWFFFYRIPGLPETQSPLGVSNVVVPGSGFSVILRYQ